MLYYNIEEQNRYSMTLTRVDDITEVGDEFMTSDELKELVGIHDLYFANPVINKNLVTAQLSDWGTKLEESGKKSIIITDTELLDTIKEMDVPGLTDYDYRRHGNRLCKYAPRKPRVKKAATKGDASHLISTMWMLAGDKNGIKWMPHLRKYEHTVYMFRMLRKLVTWRDVKNHLTQYTLNKEQCKWLRVIWLNPEEYYFK